MLAEASVRLFLFFSLVRALVVLAFLDYSDFSLLFAHTVAGAFCVFSGVLRRDVVVVPTLDVFAFHLLLARWVSVFLFSGLLLPDVLASTIILC